MRTALRLGIVVAVALVVVSCGDDDSDDSSPPASEATFIELEGNENGGWANSVNSDGSVIVGYVGTTAAIWDRDGALDPLDVGSGQAWSVSSDGSVVVGVGDALGFEQAFAVVDGEVIWLGDLEGGSESSVAYAVSPNGDFVVGQSSSSLGDEAFIWSRDSGITALGVIEDTGSSLAWGVSNDGRVVGGSGETIGGVAFEWSAGSELSGLEFGADSGMAADVACDIGPDGVVVVGGASSDDILLEAYVWRGNDELQLLGDLEGGEYGSLANSATPDGSIVVGEAITGSDETEIGTEAFVWRVTDGVMSHLGNLLEQDGIDLSGVTLEAAQDISADGTTIVGYAVVEGQQVPFAAILRGV